MPALFASDAFHIALMSPSMPLSRSRRFDVSFRLFDVVYFRRFLLDA